MPEETAETANDRPDSLTGGDTTPSGAFDDIFDKSEIEAELKGLRARTIESLKASKIYYDNAIRTKKFWARFFRGASVSASVLAGSLVVLSHQDVARLFASSTAAGETGQLPAELRFLPIPGGWALLAGVVAAATLLADRLSGTSKGWMRYVVARQEIDAIRNRYESELLRAEMEGRADILIQKCTDALKEVDEVVLEETKQWVRDYREDLEQLQKAVAKYRPGEKQPRTGQS